MKKMLFIVIMYFFTLQCFSSGGITHMFIAQEAIALLEDNTLRNILQNHFDAYLVGSYYPDSGYVEGRFGEISHWDPFILTFATYIKNNYPDSTQYRDKLVAFLFGCATHRVSDEIIHETFYPIIKNQDFNGDYHRAHKYGDPGIDVLVTIDKNRFSISPKIWWLPVKDLIKIYQKMQLKVSSEEIIRGNLVLILAGIAEKIITVPSYPYLQWKMPWTARHYYDHTYGGQKMVIEKVARYQMQLWQFLENQGDFPTYATKTTTPPDLSIYKEAFNQGLVNIPVQKNPAGEVFLYQPTHIASLKLKKILWDWLIS